MNRIGYYIREGVDSIFNHGLISFTTICVIIACLLIMGSFASVALNVNHIIGNLEDQVSLLCFVDDKWTEAEAKGLESQLLAVVEEAVRVNQKVVVALAVVVRMILISHALRRRASAIIPVRTSILM